MKNGFFGYIRVSTVKQGETGSSLQEQRGAIERYAERNGFTIISWFEEKETAAKRGRPVFGEMLKFLKTGKARGVIMHKIDRSARNLKDWADLGEFIDQGIEIHFVNESLDLRSRGGRLSADIQAVVAADFIRNLREETKKGFYGRLKQGVYPLPAPVGYLNAGKGKPKIPDPEKAWLVRKAFELYGTGKYDLADLADEMHRLGLRNRHGGNVSINGLSVLLNNPFYIGLIRIYRTNETFAGGHEPIVTKALFDRVHAVLSGKYNSWSQRHAFLFRRLLTCGKCKYSLVGENQKGHIYYRCHTKTCHSTSVREESVEAIVLKQLSAVMPTEDELKELEQLIAASKENLKVEREMQIQSLSLSLTRIEERMNRLTDAYIDRLIDKDLFEKRKTALLMEKKALDERLSDLRSGRSIPDLIAEFLEQAKSLYITYKLGFPEEKREILYRVTSNRFVTEKNVDLELKSPFWQFANREKLYYSGPYRDGPRTFGEEITKLANSNTPGSESAIKAKTIFHFLMRYFEDDDTGADGEVTVSKIAG